MGMSLRTRMAQPLKLGHALTAIAAVVGVLWGAARWAGMPEWGPGVANAQLVHRVDSMAAVQAKRDSSQDLVSLTIDARQDTVQDVVEATLRLVCTITPPEKQYLAQVKCQ